MTTASATVEIERRGAAAWLWMNRPRMHNAFDETLIAELTHALSHARSEGELERPSGQAPAGVRDVMKKPR